MDLGAACRYIFVAGQLLKINHLFHARSPSQALARRLHITGLSREGSNMALTIEGLIQELKHEIHSPLAAIRNALYLAAVRTDDPQALCYLALAHAEISRIALVLKNANQIEENKQVHLLIPHLGTPSAA
jgi:nitrogen-specific signal transduction histidine kinase